MNNMPSPQAIEKARKQPQLAWALKDRTTGRVVWCGMRKPRFRYGKWSEPVNSVSKARTGTAYRLTRIEIKEITRKK